VLLLALLSLDHVVEESLHVSLLFCNQLFDLRRVGGLSNLRNIEHIRFHKSRVHVLTIILAVWGSAQELFLVNFTNAHLRKGRWVCRGNAGEVVFGLKPCSDTIAFSEQPVSLLLLLLKEESLRIQNRISLLAAVFSSSGVVGQTKVVGHLM